MNNWLTTTLLATVATAGGIVAVNSEAALKKRIEAFRNAGDERNTAALATILHRDFRLVAYFGDAKDGMTMDKTGYTGAMSTGKIGGVKRELNIVSLDINGNHATCRLKMRSSELQFDNFMQWVLVAGEWQLLNDLTHAVPVGK